MVGVGVTEGRDRTLATYSVWCDYCMACVYGLCVLYCTDCVLVLYRVYEVCYNLSLSMGH